MPSAKTDEHGRDDELRSALERIGHANLTEHDEETQPQKGRCVPGTPERGYPSGARHTALLLNQRRDHEDMVGIEGVAQS